MPKKAKEPPKLRVVERPPSDGPAAAVAELLISLLNSIEVKEEDSRDARRMECRRVTVDLPESLTHVFERFYRRTLPATPEHRHHEHLLEAIKAALPEISDEEILALLVDAHPAKALPSAVWGEKLADPAELVKRAVALLLMSEAVALRGEHGDGALTWQPSQGYLADTPINFSNRKLRTEYQKALEAEALRHVGPRGRGRGNRRTNDPLTGKVNPRSAQARFLAEYRSLRDSGKSREEALQALATKHGLTVDSAEETLRKIPKN